MKQRFPTLDHVVDTGFMTKNEKKLFEAVPANEFNTYWVPCTWFIFRLNLKFNLIISPKVFIIVLILI